MLLNKGPSLSCLKPRFMYIMCLEYHYWFGVSICPKYTQSTDKNTGKYILKCIVRYVWKVLSEKSPGDLNSGLAEYVSIWAL